MSSLPDPVSTTTRADLRAAAGELLLVGFDGVELASITRRALARRERGGVVLFRRNVPSLDATRALCRAAQVACAEGGGGLPALVAIDQEGGRVTRLGAPFPALPPMRTLGRGGAELVRAAARVVGRGLAQLGVSFDLAPVLDVDSNPDNPVIGDRAFSSDAEACGALGVAFAAGLAEGGVLACGKHFPGHGDTTVDSHLALPTVSHDRARLDAVELAPFRAAAAAGIDALMTAHLVCDALDPGTPATFSRAICTELLRGELGFRGALLTDDLEMRAVRDRVAPDEGAVLSVRAGCDGVLICRDEAAADAAFEALVREAERDAPFRARVAEAASRMRHLRRAAADRAAAAASGPPLDDPEVVAVVERARALGGAPAGADPTEHGR